MRKPHTQDMKSFQSSTKERDRIKIIVLTAIALILLTLDWAALHDIFKGEPNLYLEYAVVVFSIILISAVIFITLKRKKEKKSYPESLSHKKGCTNNQNKGDDWNVKNEESQ